MGRRDEPDPLLLQTVSARLARLLEEAAPPTAHPAPAPELDGAAPPAGALLEVEELPPQPRFRRVHVGVVAALLLAGLLWSGWSLLRAQPVALATAPAPPLSSTAAPADPAAPASASTSPLPPAAGPAPPGAGGAGASTAAAGPGAATRMPADRVVVHVLGAVRHPGLVTLPARARVQDAVDAAGGFTRRADPGELNLAQVLQDGQQVLIGTERSPDGQVRGDSGAGAGAAAAPGGDPAGRPVAVVDLNQADTTQLEALPGVGPVTAGAILAWRSEHGRFRSIDELQEVDGIGPKTFAQLAPHVRV